MHLKYNILYGKKTFFKEYIVSNVKNYNIIDINFNSLDFENLKEYHKLNEYIGQRYKKGIAEFQK